MTSRSHIIAPPITAESTAKVLTLDERAALRREMKESSAWMRAELTRRRLAQQERIDTASKSGG